METVMITDSYFKTIYFWLIFYFTVFWLTVLCFVVQKCTCCDHCWVSDWQAWQSRFSLISLSLFILDKHLQFGLEGYWWNCGHPNCISKLRRQNCSMKIGEVALFLILYEISVYWKQLLVNVSCVDISSIIHQHFMRFSCIFLSVFFPNSQLKQ